ncbi:MAG: hypothetical protein NWE99_08945 [Candidatus Bathyarchaeota archaeon]|nr:hypothetical protein [Candidatus Bathyarchaeota archaeon]
MGLKENEKGDRVLPEFVLLFTLPESENLNKTTRFWEETKQLPEEEKRKHLNAMEEVELRLLGEKFLKAGRINRLSIGRLGLTAKNAEIEPASADIYLVSHKTGVALLEIRMDLPEQTFNPELWIPWLRPESIDGIVNQLRKRLGFPLDESSFFCFISVYVPEKSIRVFVKSHPADIIRLLYLDASPLPFKDDFVVNELDKDFCLRKSQASFMSYLTAIHISVRDKGVANELSSDIRAKCSLPFFVTIELLLLERQILGTYYDMLTASTFSSISNLIGLKDEILNGLEEYYGVITRVNQFSAPLIDYGEQTLGINNIYDSVIDRLDAVTFDITTRYQRNTSMLTFWLTVIFGALETVFLVSASLRYSIQATPLPS